MKKSLCLGIAALTLGLAVSANAMPGPRGGDRPEMKGPHHDRRGGNHPGMRGPHGPPPHAHMRGPHGPPPHGHMKGPHGPPPHGDMRGPHRGPRGMPPKDR
ncbi:MAG: hypothetical protein DHS20C10_07390 [marine bacterium B5-7]|nr:MAG: hypothetical protein DHS20C10_07390 [marine bacterium B5-7]